MTFEEVEIPEDLKEIAIEWREKCWCALQNLMKL